MRSRMFKSEILSWPKGTPTRPGTQLPFAGGKPSDNEEPSSGEVINHLVLPLGEKWGGEESVVGAEVWFLLTLFFSFIHGYSGGKDAACTGLQPLTAACCCCCFERLWRGWTPGLRPGMLCSERGGISVECENAEPLIDELWNASPTGLVRDVRHSASDGWLLMKPLSLPKP